MVSSVAIDVASGLALVFFVVATIATGINEILSRLADSRAKTLWLALANILSPTTPSGVNLGAGTAFRFGANGNDSRPQADLHPRVSGTTAAVAGAATTGTTNDPAVEATHALLATPSLRSLDPVVTKGKSTKIDNIPAAVFAAALLELATIEAGSATNDPIATKLSDVATKYPGTPLAAFLNSIATPIANDLDQYIATISTWFDGQMTRLTSIYRRNARYILLVIGLTAAVVFNVDSIDIGQTLTHDADTRAAVALLADDTANTNVTDPKVCTVPIDTSDRDFKCAHQALARLAELKVPVLGTWNTDTWTASWHGGLKNITGHLLGLLLTAGAVSFGAPFWFDLLRWLTGQRRPT